MWSDVVYLVFKLIAVTGAIFLTDYVFHLRSLIAKLLNFKSKKYPPSLKGLPILGNVHQIIKTSWPVKDMPPETHTLQGIIGMKQLFKNSDLYTVQIGSERLVVLSTPEYVEMVLGSQTVIQKSMFYYFLLPWLKEGLITSPRSKWKGRRRMLTPSFHFKILDEFHPLITDKANIFTDVLKTKLTEEYFEVDTLVSNFTMDVICETAIGIDFNAQRQESSYVKALKRLGYIAFKRMTNPWLWPNFIFSLTPSGKDFFACLKTVNDVTARVINERRTEMKKLKRSDQKEQTSSDFIEEKKRYPFLDLLVIQNLLDENSIDDEGIIEEVNTFMFAGQDTTSVGIIWTIFLLGNHPEIQEKLYQELSGVLHDDSADISTDDLKEFVYLDAVLKESQRLYPPVPMYGRTAIEDMTLGEYSIRKGSTLSIVANVLHLDEKYFPEPLHFKPERFIETSSVKRHPYAYIPFSAGPRNCIGQRFAKMEEKILIASLIRKYRVQSLETVDKISSCPELVSRPSKPVKIKIYPRNSATL